MDREQLTDALYHLHKRLGTSGIEIDVLVKTIAAVDSVISRSTVVCTAEHKAWAYKAVYEALLNDHALSHEQVKDILSGGFPLTGNEKDGEQS